MTDSDWISFIRMLRRALMMIVAWCDRYLESHNLSKSD